MFKLASGQLTFAHHKSWFCALDIRAGKAPIPAVAVVHDHAWQRMLPLPAQCSDSWSRRPSKNHLATAGEAPKGATPCCESWPRCIIIPDSYILVPCSKLQQRITRNSIAATFPHTLQLKPRAEKWHLRLGHFVVPWSWNWPLRLIHPVLSDTTGFFLCFRFIVQWLLLCLHASSNVDAKGISWILQRWLFLVTLHHPTIKNKST